MGALATCALLISATGLHSKPDTLSDQVDLVEINHCYDTKGQLVFDQLIFYDWSPSKGHYDVRDWQLIKSSVQVPRRDYRGGGFVAVWRDGPLVRKVRAKTLRESWTQYDPEVVEQAFLAKDKRRSLPKISVRRLNLAMDRSALHR